jgi:uncharacterized protein YggU (UPF0235/DUF167 family)
VRVKTGARKEKVTQEKEDLWHIEVREKAERGEANKQVRALLARELDCLPKELRLIKGQTQPSKTFLFTKHTHHEN